ncbi:MAG: hypothetical protein HFH86_03985 [Bacilli bacterium]|nr:hypothetical protein [Bacilli bacterium]
MYDEEVKKPNKEKKTFRFPKLNLKMPNVSFKIDYRSAFTKFGLLALCVFAFIFISTKMSQSNEKKVFDKNLDIMKSGAYKYFQEYERPEEVNEEYNITLQDLIEADLVEPLKDKKGNICDSEMSNVSIIKKTNTKYDLVATLSCNQKEEEKNYNLTYSSNNSNHIETQNVYYKLQKAVTKNNYTYSCPEGYILNGKYCFGKTTTLTLNAIPKYRTTSAKTTKASYKDPSNQYEYVEAVLIKQDDQYICSDSNATLINGECIIKKDATIKNEVSYECFEGELEGSKCIMKTDPIKTEYKYTCPSGTLIGTQCELKQNYKLSYTCPSDYPYRDGDQCYYIDAVDYVWGDWEFSSRQTYSREMDYQNNEYRYYDLIDTYRSSNGKWKYVYEVFTRHKEAVCNENRNEEVNKKGSRCYHYIDATEQKKCSSGYILNEDGTKCIKMVEAKKVKTNTTYTCPSGYQKKGSSENTICYQTKEAEKKINAIPVCNNGYNLSYLENGNATCIKTKEAQKIPGSATYVCPTGYTADGSGKDMKCYRKVATLEGYYYCKNQEARLEGTKCIIDSKTELVGYSCTNGYQYNGKECVKNLAGEKIAATKTNNPDINITYKWSTKKSESGWTWTGETKEIEA